MDIPLQPASRTRKKPIAVLLAIVLVLAVAALHFVRSRNLEISRGDVSLVAVREGDVQFEIAAYGTLVPLKEKLLTSPGTATVEDVLIKPGDKVKAGELLLRLSSADLIERRSQAKALLEQARLDLKESQLSAHISNMEESARVRSLATQSALDEAERDALRPIAERGIVTKFEMKRTEAKVAASQAQLRDQAARAKLMREVNSARVSAKRDALNNAQALFAAADQAATALEIRSSLAGTVQDMYVSLGQGVALGEKLALVTGNDGLLARLKVPQGKAGAIAVGGRVSLDVQGRKFASLVSNIDPRVRDGSVHVDVLPQERLPAGARADQSVTGQIQGTSASGSIYVERRDDIAPFEHRDVFVLSGDRLVRRRLEFGAGSGNYVEIVSGARSGDQIATGLDESYYRRDFIKVVN